ncbi:family 16 glycosylhydrolase [Sphingomonas solaris]|nr:family 16 glycosylhydrolase [Sphingomonas solaris]
MVIPNPAEAKAATALLVAFLGGSPATPPPAARPDISPLAVKPTLVIPDTVVLPGERIAHVRVQLSKPARRPLTWRCTTTNGSAYAPAFYSQTVTTVIFQPGETVQVIDVPILRDLTGKDFKLSCPWTLVHPPVPSDTVGVIRGARTRAPLPAIPKPSYPAVAREKGRKLAFSSTFMEPIVPDVRPGTWRSRFGWGRVQTGNKEIAPYTDATTDPGVTPHPIVDGKRVLRAEHVATKDDGKEYAFSASLIDSASLFTFQYGYVEARVKFARAQGTVAAFWLLPASGKWPPEIDIFETGLGDRPAFASSIRFAKDSYGTADSAMVLPGVEDGRWHVIGFDWTRDWQVTFIDGVEVSRRPNLFNEPMKIIFDVSVGGLGPDPVDPGPGWKSELALDYLKVWR